MTWRMLGATFALLGSVAIAIGGAAEKGPIADSVCDGNGFRAMTYNIRTGLGTRNPGKNPLHMLFARHDVGPVIAAIAEADPHVVALQEVLGRRQAQEIADALGMQVAYAHHPSPIPWWGNAVLSKCPIAQHRRVVTSRGKGNGKAMPVAEVRIGGQVVTVTSLHRDRDDNTGKQMERALFDLRAAPGPVVFMGDFNFKPTDARYARVSKLFDDSAVVARQGGNHVQLRGTYPVDEQKKKGRRIDFVFLSEGDFEVPEVRLIQGKYHAASDHLGYVATVEMNVKGR